MPSFYEFFAGGGMARAGLGASWTCLFANDFDPKKGAAYRANWGGGAPKTCPELRIGDVRQVQPAELPGTADLVWGSFPCQDLSLAGAGAGLDGERSGTFYPFWQIIRGLAAEGRAPRLIAVENVPGALTSHGGRDFAAIADAFAGTGYRHGALLIDAALFLPQSRPRLFVVGVREDLDIPPGLLAQEPLEPFHPAPVRRAAAQLAGAAKAKMAWWRLPAPPRRNTAFAELVEGQPAGVTWHTPAQTRELLAKMSPVNQAKVAAAQAAGRRMVGCVYKRTRRDRTGAKAQRAEVRFDDVAGCLRTPAGGSSRQIVLVVEGPQVRSRLMSPREAARLMGLDDGYLLPENYNEAYHLAGDGVVVNVVRHLAEHLLEPLLGTGAKARIAA